MQWLLIVISVFLVSTMLAGIIIPQILLISFRKKLFDEPDERKIHKGAVPRLGGLAFMPSIVFSLCFVWGTLLLAGESWLSSFHVSQLLSSPHAEGLVTPLCFGLCALMMMYLVGIADDLIGIKYRAKFVAQILAALLLAAAGVRVDSLEGMLGIYELPVAVSWMLTVFLVVFITNAINLIDGIDGLASGLSAIALITYTIVFFQGGQYIFAMLAAGAAGTLVPFFYYNVFGDPGRQKKIFMGDTGSLTTGLILVFCSIAVVALYPVSTHPYAYNPVVIAVCPLMIPAFDVVRVYFHRIRCHRNPFLPDKGHIHHKLLALGMKQSSALMFILLASAIFIGCNVMLSPYTNPNLLFGADIVVWTLANILLTKAIRRREKRLGVTLYE